MSVRKLLFSAT